MTPLEQQIRQLIETEGPLPVSRYMGLALSDPRHGYYATRDPFGAGGDFTTAPEMSQIFGELIGLWCAELWRLMGEPSPLRLVELGPGRGTLMADLLRAAKVVPAFRAALDVHLVETSPVLTERQRVTLAPSGIPLHWHAGMETLPAGPLVALANEFVDALPVDQLVKTEDGWHERRVGMKNGRLAFGLDPAPLPGIEKILPARLRPSPSGAVIERRDLMPVGDIARRIAIHGGAALVIDYGYARSAFGDTLQAVRAHRFADPLDSPGEADLTAHVDFEALATAAEKQGAEVHGPVAQGIFLRRLGIELRAEKIKLGKEAETRAAIDAGIARLTGPAPGMGELFKALAFAHRDLRALPGFDS
ncbi:MAG: SAM-dependent methyltransferase [Xanthobacteraceae bacterium]|nr:SAM-dependent methyltransferase [Xanthobacteraceae bacterium]